MSNHSSQMDPEIAKMFMQQFEKAKRAQGDINQLGFGPTGQFPEGRLTQADEGEIRIGITNHQGKVVIDFGSPVTWIGFTPELAELLAESLLAKAKKARAEQGNLTELPKRARAGSGKGPQEL